MRQQIPKPMGLMETSAAGKVPLGHYDEGENVRDFDERGQRDRLASRMGLIRLGVGTPCPGGTPVVHTITAKRPLPKRVFVNLTEAAQEDTEPAQLAQEWAVTPGDGALAASLGADGLLYVLEDGGQVSSLDQDGNRTELFVVPQLRDYELIPSIYADAFEGVIVGQSSAIMEGDEVTLFSRFALDEEDAWVEEFQEGFRRRVTEFYGDDNDVFALSFGVGDSVEGPFYALTRLGGINTEAWSELWTVSAPDPVYELAFTGTAVYAAAFRNEIRGGQLLAADVQWTPFEYTNAATRLYSGLSAIREQSIRGLTPGQEVAQWEEARFEITSFPSIIDTTDRYMRRSPVVENYRAPSLKDDPEGRGVEVSFDNLDDTLGVMRMESVAQSTSSQVKADASTVASWQTSMLPIQFDPANASGTSPRWFMTTLLRLVNHGTATEWKSVVSQSGLRLKYRGDANVEIALDIPGTNEVVTTTLTGATGPDGRTVAYAVVTLVCDTYGSAGSKLRVNGVDIGATFTINETFSDRFTNFATPPGFNNDGPGLALTGGIKEFWVTMADSVGAGTHRDALPADDIERMEAFQVYAHGCQDILDPGHTYAGAIPASGGTPPTFFDLTQGLRQPEDMTVKYRRATGDLVWTRTDGANGRGVAVGPDGKVFVAGDQLALDGGALPPLFEQLTDNGPDTSVDWTVSNPRGVVSPGPVDLLTWRDQGGMLTPDRCGGLLVGFRTIFGVAPDPTGMRRYDGDGALDWDLSLAATGVGKAFASGFFVDDRQLPSGACGTEFAYVLQGDGQSGLLFQPRQVSRIELLGRQATGETRDQEIEQVAFCQSGAISRLTEGRWEAVTGTFSAGERPWSFEYFGLHFIGSPEQYLVWEPNFKRIRDWTPEPGSIIPQRIKYATRWRGRVLCYTEDDPHILFGSRVGNAFDWTTGGDIQDATQAFAGTTAAAGAIPDPIVSIMPVNDDLCMVGTTRSLWRITGDPQNGGVLDDVLATEGVLGPFSHARGDSGELYWMTTSLRVVQMQGRGLADLSTAFIRGRLQAINPEETRVELHWSQRAQGLYVLFMPRDGVPQADVVHLFWSKRTGRWHPTRFPGGAGRGVASAIGLDVADPGGWGLALGFADGALRVEHPEALDDDGERIPWRLRLPMGGDGDPARSLVTHAELVLAPDQGPVEVTGLAARTGEADPDRGPTYTVQPGRGDSAPVQVAGTNTWLELAGQDPAAVDDLAVHIHPWGAA